MGKHQPAISRRGFVAASGAVALGAGLGATATGCSSGGGAAKGGDAQKEGKWVPTTCNMCFNQCSILAHVVDGKVVELKGNPDSPVGRGHICAKGASGIMQLYDPNRITKPMKRTNPKKGFDQDPGWEEISWDEAYELVNKNISEAIERSGPHAVSCCSMAAIIAPSYLQTPCSGGFFISRVWKPPGTMAQDSTQSRLFPWAIAENAPNRVVFFSPYGPFMEKSAFVCR